ncbi:MAG: hypothetical protein HQK66_04620, partial [Desulfamplus sp.]|nr:hypothetical protein [Desulfamplus sp.]
QSGIAPWSEFIFDFIRASGGNPDAGSNTMNGGFAFAALWLDNLGAFSDADVDIYVVEPDGTIGSCWMGSSTPNGYYSPDSALSGDSYEMYATKDQIDSGTYMYIVNYYDDGYWDNFAYVYLFYMDPAYGVHFWDYLYDATTGSPFKKMHRYNPAPEYWSDYVIFMLLQGYYSDWWIPMVSQRALSGMSFAKQKETLLKIKSISNQRRGKHGSRNMLNLYDAYIQKQR